MKKKSTWLLKTILIITILMILILPSVVAAPMAQQGLFGDLIEKITVSLQKFLSYTITIPHAYPMGRYAEVVPLWGVFAVFTLLFSIIYPASSRIKIFDEEHKGAQKAFCVATALIVMFGTPITELLVITFASYFATLASLLLLVGLLIGLWFVLFLFPHRGIAIGSKFIGESRKERNVGKKLSHDALIEKKDLKRSKRAYRKLHRFLKKGAKSIGDLKEHLKKIREMVARVKSISAGPEAVDRPEVITEAKNKITNELGGLTSLVDKERNIDIRARRIADRIQRLNIAEFNLTKKEGTELKTQKEISADIKRKYSKHHNISKLKEGELERYLIKLLQDEKYIMQVTNRIRQMQAEFAKLSEQLKELVERASLEVSRNSFPQADNTLVEAINILEKQDQLIGEMENMERRIEGIVREEFRIESYIQKEETEEVRETQQEIKKEKKKRGLTLKVMGGKPTKGQLKDV